jgi:broad specificity phosphatase PhoE
LKTKTIIIVRHAHRDKPHGRKADDGLSPKGKKQARALTKFLAKHLDQRPRILTSPKARCQETIEPIAEKLKVKFDCAKELMEHGDFDQQESEEQFRRRVADFCDSQMATPSPLTILCSHGDWIPVALEHLTGLELSLKKGGWAEIKIQNETPHLTWLVQGL